ncbi:MAG: ABC transporter permease [Peptococcaceae bacterium]|nr:ABC transporter permease [Peptococcaceae bacterium]
MTLLIGSLQLGLLYGLLALGVYITFRILNIPDLTADGSFTLGLAVSAALALGGHPLLGLAAALLAGCLAGAVTGFLQTKGGIHPILAGILTMSGLYTVNLFTLGATPNVSLIGKDTLFSLIRDLYPALSKDAGRTLISLAAGLLLFGLLSWFFKTHLGLCIRATGDNEDMVRSSSINVDFTKIAALSISNGCVALSGALINQYQGYADMSSGVGIVVVGLASVIIGETLLGRRGVSFGLFSALAGSLIYRLMVALAVKSSFFPAYGLKLVSAMIVAAALSLPALRERLHFTRLRKEARRHAENQPRL